MDFLIDGLYIGSVTFGKSDVRLHMKFNLFYALDGVNFFLGKEHDFPDSLKISSPFFIFLENVPKNCLVYDQKQVDLFYFRYICS